MQGRASRPEARSTPTEDAKHSAQDSLFEAIDTNRDGTLSAEEFTDFFSARLENGEEPDSLMALFAAIDKDNSGGIDRTEFREGSHLLHSLHLLLDWLEPFCHATHTLAVCSNVSPW